MIYKNHNLDINNWDFLKKTQSKNKIPNALLFHGNDGVGKELAAIEYAAYINCEAPIDDFACGKCNSCYRIRGNNHEYINYIFPLPKGKITSKKDDISKSFTEKTLQQYTSELNKKLENPFHKIHIDRANTILINSIRSIKNKIYKTADNNVYRAIIIFEAEKLCYPNNEAANSLLKILEEPPSQSIFILITSKNNLLLDTIKSRCIELYFPNPSIEEFNSYANSLESFDINLYKLLDGNIKLLNKLDNNFINEIKVFIKDYNRKLIDGNNIDLKLISYISKLSKTDKLLFEILIQALKYYYKDLMNIKFKVKEYQPTFPFLNYNKIASISINHTNYIDMIEQFEKDCLINLNLDLSLFNLFNNLRRN